MSFGQRHEMFRPKKEGSEFESYKKSGEDFINAHKKLFATFAADVSLRFTMADKFQIDYEKGLISLDSKWFFEKGYNKEQILWATFHELSHFRDLAQDKNGVMDGFKYIKEKGEKLAKESGMNPDLAYKTYHTLFNCLDDIYVNKVVSRRASFYEHGRKGGKQVQDLYRDKLFKDTDLSVAEDGAKIPNHLQFAFYLLRKAMLPDQEIIVSEEVKKALDTKVTVGRREYTPEEIIQTFMLPNKSRDAKASVRHTYLKQYIEPVYESLIRKDIEDANKPQESENNESGDGKDEKNDKQEENENSDGGESKPDTSKESAPSDEKTQSDAGNENDTKDEAKNGDEGESKPNAPQESDQPGDSPQEEKGGEEQNNSKPDTDNARGDGQSPTNQERANEKFNEWAQIHSEFQSNSPDQLDEKEIEKFIEQQDTERNENAEKEKESKKISTEPKDIQANTDQEWADKNKTKNRDVYEELRSLRDIEENIMPYLNSMTELWQDIMAGVSTEIGHAKEKSFVSGSELNIDSVVENIGAIYAGQSAPRIYNKITEKEVTVEKPEIIRVRLVIDKSGSMTNDDGTKSKVMNQSLVLILRSIQQFNEMLDLTRGSTGSKLKVETQVLGFGERLYEIKKLESDDEQETEPTLAVLDTLKRSGGVNNAKTYDYLALEQILKSQDDTSQQKIKQGKILDLLFEITDGGSSAHKQSKEAVDKMSEIGVHARAFQIGRVDEEERQLFNYVWNGDENNKRGQVVGRNIEGLLPALTEALKKQLSGVRI